MDANQQKLKDENAQLKKLLAQMQQQFRQTQTELSLTQTELSKTQSQFTSAKKQHSTELEQLTATLENKNRSIAAFEHQIKLLLKKITGSRQERVDPDQLLLFSSEQLQEIFDRMEQPGPTEDLVETDPSKGAKRRKKHGRSGKLPDHLPREIIRYELDQSQRACPCCGDERDEIGVESSEQLELIPAQLKI